MTYQIGYTPKGSPKNSRGFVMFDIEYYQTFLSGDNKKWYSELSCLPCVDGLTMFLKDRFGEGGFNHEEFIKDGEEIQELRRLLYEQYDNRPRESKEADEFHYHTFRDKLEEIIYDFAKKYGLWVNID